MVQNVAPFLKDTSPRELSVYIDFSEAVVLDVETARPFKLLTVATTGDVAVEGLAGNTIVFPAVNPGQLIPVRGVKVLSAGTTASGVYVYWGL